MAEDEIVTRPARVGDGQAVFEITRQSIAGLSRGSYTPQQIANWMGSRTPSFYEDLIANGRMVVAARGSVIVGFVDAEPGEVTRLFVLPSAAGHGLGQTLLRIGVGKAADGHTGTIKLEATLNAEDFYKRQGFNSVGRGIFSHGVDSDPIEIVYMELENCTSTLA